MNVALPVGLHYRLKAAAVQEGISVWEWTDRIVRSLCCKCRQIVL